MRQQIVITGYHGSVNGNGKCDVCRKNADCGVSITLPSMQFEYCCKHCVFNLTKAVTEAEKSARPPSVAKAS